MIDVLKNKPIIINTDLDGILSGLFLQEYLNCKIVGFSNSAEKIWIETDFINYKNVCFVDLFVASPELVTIDQHIVTVNAEHHQKLADNPNKINPNILNPRFFKEDKNFSNCNYYHKYPFGTVHFIIALLEKYGFKVKEINTKNSELMDYLLRADDTLKTTVDSNYTSNAAEWWQWLQAFSENGVATSFLIKYLTDFNKENVPVTKERVKKKLLSEPYFCNSPDGGIVDILNGKILKDNVKSYFRFIANILNIDIFDLNKEYDAKSGIAERFILTEENEKSLIEKGEINGKRVFSYAFVRSERRENSFSCTFYKSI